MRLCYVSSELRQGEDLNIDKRWWETECWPLTDVLKKISQLGLREVELSPPHVSIETSLGELGKIKATLKAQNIRSPCLDSTVLLWGVKNSDSKQVKKFIQLARALDADFVKVFSAPVKSASRLQAIRFLKRSAQQAEASGVRLCVENIWDQHLGTIQKMKRGLEEIGSESVAALVDLTNFYVSGDNPVDAVKALGDRIAHVHVKDALREGKNSSWRMIGKGDLSTKGLYPEIIAELNRLGYQGCLSIEPHVFPSLEALEESVRFLRPLVG